MKYLVKINGDEYKVEILDLKTRPVIAIVNGEQVEVWPEETTALTAPSQVSATASQSTAIPLPLDTLPSGGVLDRTTVRAPIPGVILEVEVKPGDSVVYGQSLFIIEAMKMRNNIRASRSGTVAEVCVSPGQTVNHSDPLLEYTE